MVAVLFNPIDPDFLADPYPTYARLRQEAPVYRHPGGFFAVSRYEDVQTVLKTPETFSSQAMGGGRMARTRPPDEVPIGAASLISLDPPEHGQQRAIVNRGFTPRRISDLEPRARGVVDELFGKFVHAGGCDLVADLSAPLPVTMIAELLGLDVSRRDDFKRWSNELIVEQTTAGAGARSAQVMETMKEAGTYLLSVIEARRAEPQDDLVSILVDAEQGQGVLTPAEVLGFASLLLAAGSETTTNLIGNAVLALLAHPEALEEVVADPSLVPALVEETLRYESPVQLLMRLTTEATELRGTELPKGSLVMVILGSANRDEEQFERADRFDLHRNAQGHLAFGFGNHFCLGAALARLEGRVALESVLTRLREPRLDASVVERHGSFLVRGPRALPLRFAA